MLQGFWLAVQAVLSRLAPKMLPAIVVRLTTMGAKISNGSVSGIMLGMKNWVGNNMGKVSLLISVLSSVGVTLDHDQLAAIEPKLLPYVDRWKAATDAALIVLEKENSESRHLYTGDGKDNGDDGIDPESDIVVGKAAKKLILRAAFATGNVANLEALREVIFMDESKFLKGMALLK
jgi:hypothetical protein